MPKVVLSIRCTEYFKRELQKISNKYNMPIAKIIEECVRIHYAQWIEIQKEKK